MIVVIVFKFHAQAFPFESVCYYDGLSIYSYIIMTITAFIYID